ncbi:MAG: hypothetical protein ACE5G0_03250 [Rhodothermales bacterium]
MRVLIVNAVLLGVAVPVWSQSAPVPRVEDIWRAYQQLDYTAAADSAQAALEAFERYTPQELADVHTILGLLAFSQNPSETRYQFTQALNLNPRLALDSLMVSPKILTFFEQVKSELAQARPDENTTPSAVRYVIVEDRRVEAALRSMVLPGWGQLHKGERTKGRILLGVWGAAAGGLVTTHLLRRQAENRYRAADTPADALARYGPFDRWHKARNAFLLGAAGVWIYSYVDALIAGTPSERRHRLLITPTVSERRVHVVMRLHF